MAQLKKPSTRPTTKKSTPKKEEVRIPEGVIERLSTYLESLMQLDEQQVKTVSSKRLGSITDIHPAEIRRDFTFFGTFGKKGVGYSVKNLVGKLQKILGADEPHKLALIGAGNLGTAIASYDGLKRHGFNIAAIFDNDKTKIGTKIGKVTVMDTKKMVEVIDKEKIHIGVVAVPTGAAQKATDLLVAADIKIIINYTSAMVKVPDHVKVHNTEPVKELLHTLYYFSSRGDHL